MRLSIAFFATGLFVVSGLAIPAAAQAPATPPPIAAPPVAAPPAASPTALAIEPEKATVGPLEPIKINLRNIPPPPNIGAIQGAMFLVLRPENSRTVVDWKQLSYSAGTEQTVVFGGRLPGKFDIAFIVKDVGTGGWEPSFIVGHVPLEVGAQ